MLLKLYRSLLKYTFVDILILTSICFIIYLLGNSIYLIYTDNHWYHMSGIEIEHDLFYNLLKDILIWLISSAIISFILYAIKYSHKKKIKKGL